MENSEESSIDKTMAENENGHIQNRSEVASLAQQYSAPQQQRRSTSPQGSPPKCSTQQQQAILQNQLSTQRVTFKQRNSMPTNQNTPQYRTMQQQLTAIQDSILQQLSSRHQRSAGQGRSSNSSSTSTGSNGSSRATGSSGSSSSQQYHSQQQHQGNNNSKQQQQQQSSGAPQHHQGGFGLHAAAQAHSSTPQQSVINKSKSSGSKKFVRFAPLPMKSSTSSAVPTTRNRHPLLSSSRLYNHQEEDDSPVARLLDNLHEETNDQTNSLFFPSAATITSISRSESSSVSSSSHQTNNVGGGGRGFAGREQRLTRNLARNNHFSTMQSSGYRATNPQDGSKSDGTCSEYSVESAESAEDTPNRTRKRAATSTEAVIEEEVVRPPFKLLCQRKMSSMLPPPLPVEAAGVFSRPSVPPPSSMPQARTPAPAPAPTPPATHSKKEQRYQCTKAALQQSGLLELTMQMSGIIRDMERSEAELRQLRKDSHAFLVSVLTTPENVRFREYLMHTILFNFKTKIRQPNQPPDP